PGYEVPEVISRMKPTISELFWLGVMYPDTAPSVAVVPVEVPVQILATSNGLFGSSPRTTQEEARFRASSEEKLIETSKDSAAVWITVYITFIRLDIPAIAREYVFPC